MPEYQYSVIVDNTVLAKGMTLTTALLLVEAQFNKWHSESDITISIKREEGSADVLS